eukprot:m.22517 g.22517  ORF g.22517 m.22517 type:complete len:339 (-) comp8858_c0_seq2:76-1092(-)
MVACVSCGSEFDCFETQACDLQHGDGKSRCGMGLLKRYGQSDAIKLSDCEQCGEVTDPYLEMDTLSLWLGVVLLDCKTIMHLIHNRPHRNDWLGDQKMTARIIARLFIGILLLQAYVLLHRTGLPLFSSDDTNNDHNKFSKSSDSIGDNNIQTMFNMSFWGTLLSSTAITSNNETLLEMQVARYRVLYDFAAHPPFVEYTPLIITLGWVGVVQLVEVVAIVIFFKMEKMDEMWKWSLFVHLLSHIWDPILALLCIFTTSSQQLVHNHSSLYWNLSHLFHFTILTVVKLMTLRRVGRVHGVVQFVRSLLESVCVCVTIELSTVWLLDFVVVPLTNMTLL